MILWVCSTALPLHAQKLDRAVLAFGSNGGNLTPFWTAREAGLYRQYGLDVDVVFFRGSTIAINALATNRFIKQLDDNGFIKTLYGK